MLDHQQQASLMSTSRLKRFDEIDRLALQLAEGKKALGHCLAAHGQSTELDKHCTCTH